MTDTDGRPLPGLGRQLIFRDPEGTLMPGIVNGLIDGKVHLVAFDPVLGPRNFEAAGEGEGPGQYRLLYGMDAAPAPRAVDFEVDFNRLAELVDAGVQHRLHELGLTPEFIAQLKDNNPERTAAAEGGDQQSSS